MTKTLTTPILMALAILLVSGCASTPSPLDGEFTNLTPDRAGPESIGRTVRWGGEIIETRPQAELTCIEILARPLDSRGRPLAGDQILGRFQACRPGFQDPAVFSPGRELTVIGAIESLQERLIGEFSYRYPQVDARTVYLWQERQTLARDPYWYPWYGPRGWWYGYY